jgi:lactoylglutathione lyase
MIQFTMKLNHLNLTVTDVPETCRFLVKYFGLRLHEGGRRNFQVLLDDDGLSLTLMGAGSRGVSYPAHFHIGFAQPSTERVNEIYERMKEDGVVVEPPARHHAWTFYVQAPGGFSIEVASPLE